jgi:hypothetical protein
MVPSERMICSPVMSGNPTTVNRIRSPDFNGITSLSWPELIPDFIIVGVLAGNGLVVSVEKVGVIDGITLGRINGGVDGEVDGIDDGVGDGVDNSEGIGAAIVEVIVLRKNSP